jgi:hypothetical protein
VKTSAGYQGAVRPARGLVMLIHTLAGRPR